MPMYYLANERPEENQKKPEEGQPREEAQYDSVEQPVGHAGSQEQKPEEDW